MQLADTQRSRTQTERERERRLEFRREHPARTGYGETAERRVEDTDTERKRERDRERERGGGELAFVDFFGFPAFTCVFAIASRFLTLSLVHA